MADKDFLGSIAEETQKKPASFAEEKVVRVDKKPVNVGLIVVALAALAAIGVGAYFLFFAPKITMENFVGKQVSDVSAWVRQYEIENTGIVMTKEYSTEYDENYIIAQSVEPGTKIKKDVKVTFTVSQGADPQEYINFPDLKSMELSEINAWIKENKLSNTRVSTSYDATVPENRVVSYDLRNISESQFQRGSSLSITVSKGPKPAATVTVDQDFVGKDLYTLETWAQGKNLKVKSTEVSSDTVEAGKIISCSVKKDDTIKEGETITCTVSKGKVVRMVYFGGWKLQDVEDWCMDYGVTYSGPTYEYHLTTPKDELIYQSIPAGSIVEPKTRLKLIVSLGKPTFAGCASKQDVEDRKNDILSKMTFSHCDITINPTWHLDESKSPDQVISLTERIENNTLIVDVVYSKGENLWLENTADLSWEELVVNPHGYTEQDERVQALLQLAKDKGIQIVRKYEKTADEGIDTEGTILSVARSDKAALKGNSFIPQNTIIYVTIYDSNAQ
ncbi:MAG: PASTA domain-containing protein [Erysipelotrichaceae bacterium]|nr:PASTA domain-containing protein [Erysipelotrichaceae bacterium]